jgi:ribosomal protein S18 acetylase RimI-like enzyme
MTKELLRQSYSEIINIYAQAFSGYPWYENLSYTEIEARIKSHENNTHFELVLIRNDGNEIIGATWFYEDSELGIIQQKNGRKLQKVLQKLMSDNEMQNVVYICDTIVATNHQGKGVATELKGKSLDIIKNKYLNGVILYTRMRDDNNAIIKINSKHGFQRTRIKVASSSNPDVFHEYWFKIIKDSNEKN